MVRRGVDKDERTIAIERVEIDRLSKDKDDEKNILENNYKQNLVSLFKNKTSNVNLDSISKDNKISDADLENKNIEFLEQISVNDESTMEHLAQKKIYNDAIILFRQKVSK